MGGGFVVLGGVLFDAQLVHEPGGLLFLLFDGFFEVQDFVLELPDLEFGLMLLLVEVPQLLLPLLLYLHRKGSTSLSLFSST